MTLQYLKNAIEEVPEGIYFTYHGKMCGMDICIEDSVWDFYTWCGKKEAHYKTFDEMACDKFFDGKSLEELVENVEIGFG